MIMWISTWQWKFDIWRTIHMTMLFLGIGLVLSIIDILWEIKLLKVNIFKRMLLL